MSTSLQNRMESALANLRAQQEKIREFGFLMAERKVAVTSKNRMISATVDSYGRLVDLAMAAAAEISPKAFEFGSLTGREFDLDAMFDAAARLAEQPIPSGEESGKQVRDV